MTLKLITSKCITTLSIDENSLNFLMLLLFQLYLFHYCLYFLNGLIPFYWTVICFKFAFGKRFYMQDYYYNSKWPKYILTYQLHWSGSNTSSSSSCSSRSGIGVTWWSQQLRVDRNSITRAIRNQNYTIGCTGPWRTNMNKITQTLNISVTL